MFFGKKSQYSSLQTYSLETDKIKNDLALFIDFSVLEDNEYKVLSIERVDVNKADEKTVIFTVKSSECENYDFYISRAQHKKLIQDWAAIKNSQKPLDNSQPAS